MQKQKMIEAWEQIWRKKSTCHLPTNMPKTLPLNNIGPIQLYKDPKLGYLNLQLHGLCLNQLNKVENGGIQQADNGEYVAVLNFTELSLSGQYQVAAVKALLPERKPNSPLGILFKDELAEEEALQLADQYRNTLMQTSNGQMLVNQFYHRNEMLNSIVLAENPSSSLNGSFQHGWINESTNGHHTDYFMHETIVAAREPDNTGTGLASDDYDEHGFYMFVLLHAEASELGEEGQALAKEIEAFFEGSSSYQGPKCTNAIMQAVASGNPNQSQQPGVDYELRKKRAALLQKAKTRATKKIQYWKENRCAESYVSAIKPQQPAAIPQLQNHFAQFFMNFPVSIHFRFIPESRKIQVTKMEIKHEKWLKDLLSEKNLLAEQVNRTLLNLNFIDRIIQSYLEALLGSKAGEIVSDCLQKSLTTHS